MPQCAGTFAACYVNEKDIAEDFIDKNFETKSAQLADAAYRLWNKGVLLQSSKEQIELQQKLDKPTLRDEYVFLKKYWGTPWSLYAFVIRIFTFKNVFKEIPAFYAATKIERINPYANPEKHSDYEKFNNFLNDEPFVAVIIPTLNRYAFLKDVLCDLEKQDYKNFEVLIYDQSDNFNAAFYKQFKLQFKIVHQPEKLLWTARNNAIKNTSAEYLLFFDDDSRVQPDWISEHLKCLQFFDADISAGVSLAAIGQKISKSYSYFRWADQFDSGNAMVKRSIFKKIGLFDEQFNGMRMGDAEFGFRAYTNGFKSISNPNAARVHLKAASGGLREMGSWDGFRPKKWFAPKPVPSVVFLFKKYFPKQLYTNAILIGIMLSNISYKQKRSSAMLFLSVLLTVIKSPVLAIQFSRSKKIAEKMLQNNNGIKLLS